MADMFAKAAAYDVQMGRWSARMAPLFAEFAQVRDGGRILDVGCGTGALVQLLADVTQRSAIVGIDLSQPFIDCTRSRFTGPRFSFDVGNAMELPYPDASFDQSLSLLVLQMLPQPNKAAKEMRRVTRSGGTIAACTWAHGEGGLEMNAIFWEEAIKLDPAAENEAERSRHCNRRGELTELWRAAGLDAVEEVVLEIRTDFSCFDDYWLPYTSSTGPPGVYVDTLSPERREVLRKALRTRLVGGATDSPITLRARGLAVRGTVPS